VRNDETWRAQRHPALYTGDSMMIHFPSKRYLFVSTTRAIRSWDWEAKKVESLKYFEEEWLINIFQTHHQPSLASDKNRPKVDNSIKPIRRSQSM
jgi:hypothetical protein